MTSLREQLQWTIDRVKRLDPENFPTRSIVYEILILLEGIVFKVEGGKVE